MQRAHRYGLRRWKPASIETCARTRHLNVGTTLWQMWKHTNEEMEQCCFGTHHWCAAKPIQFPPKEWVITATKMTTTVFTWRLVVPNFIKKLHNRCKRKTVANKKSKPCTLPIPSSWKTSTTITLQRPFGLTKQPKTVQKTWTPPKWRWLHVKWRRSWYWRPDFWPVLHCGRYPADNKHGINRI